MRGYGPPGDRDREREFDRYGGPPPDWDRRYHGYREGPGAFWELSWECCWLGMLGSPRVPGSRGWPRLANFCKVARKNKGRGEMAGGYHA